MQKALPWSLTLACFFVCLVLGSDGPSSPQRSRESARRSENGLGMENEGTNAVRIQSVTRYRRATRANGSCQR